MADRNSRARQQAVKRGEDTYHREVIVYWPACTVCEVPIRHNLEIDKPGLWRSCGCLGVMWRSDMHGWTKVLAAPAPGLDHPAGRGEGEQ